ncbi:putative ABC transport system permease protein [Streptomyces griseochromogenes]|uniref:ABC transport system permease protein n=1 Tax=Streptomyces griseochromogenes TaxID=68214 RepID=A0A1B1AP77_9ACTN|nr:ABC transporter permease [Streptomyces griseochromogenes]ANP48361.1 ABC transporter permease [Streptomyces griseochromogenes]MBP2052989.1 putative ABC transport system permease protein [Streptomyces griseochromogenes]
MAVLTLALKTLRHRKAAFAGAFVTLLCAAALITACGMLLETGLRGRVAPERYAGAPLLVAGDQYVHRTVHKSNGKTKHKAKPIAERAWIPASLTAKLRRTPGVREAVAEVTFPVGTGGGRAQGHGWDSAALTPFTLASGHAPRTGGEVVVDARSGARVGTRLSVLTPAGPAAYRVSGVTRQALPGQDTLFFAPAEARRLAGRPGQVSAIGVFPKPGERPEVAAALRGTGALEYTGEARGAVEFLDAQRARVKLVSLGGALGGTSLLVAILVVAGTFALSVQQRQREIALLRAVAATPKQLRRLLGGEALVIAVAAGAAGSAAGVGLGFWLRSRFVALGAVPEHLRLVVSPFPVFAALLATMLAAWAAARLAARRAVRVRPAEALGEAALPTARLPWARLVAGLLATAGAVVLTLVLSTLSTEAASSPVVMVTALMWTVAVSLLGPPLARAAAALLAVPLRASRVGGHLAAANLRTGSRRLASVITPLCLLVAMTCTILFTQTTMGHAAQREVAAGSRADYVLGPQVPGPVARSLRGRPGVEAVTEVLHTSVRVGLSKYAAQAVTTEGLTRTTDLGVTAGSLRGLGKDSMAVSENAAGRLGVSVGDTVSLTLGDGTPATLKVAALYTRGLGYGDLTLSHDLVAPHVDDPMGTLYVAAPGLSRAELSALVAGVPSVTVMDRARAVAASAPDAEVNYVAMGLIIAFSAISVINTLGMATADRSRELALLRLVGTTRRQVLRVLRLEALAALAIATVLGTGIALLTLTAFATGMTGSPLPHIPPLTYLGVLAPTAALALAATSLPARAALRQRPAEAVGGRQ